MVRYVSRSEFIKLQKLARLAITGAMMTAPTAAMEVLLGLTPLPAVTEAEAGIYRLMCSH